MSKKKIYKEKVYLATIKDYIVFVSKRQFETADEQHDEVEIQYNKKYKDEGLGYADIELKEVRTISKVPIHLQDEVPYGSLNKKTARECLKTKKNTTVEIDGDYIIVEGKTYKKV